MMTDAELTILSLVAEGAQYGHEIQELIDKRGLRDWVTIGFSSVYYLLNKLEKQNMVISTLDSQGHHVARRSYTITEAGRGVLQTAISDLLRHPRSLGTGFELGLVNLHVLKPQQVYTVLSHHKSDLEERLSSVESEWHYHIEEQEGEVEEHIAALYTHSIAIMLAELAWITDFLTDWREHYPSVENNVELHISTPSTPTKMNFTESSDPAVMIHRLKPSEDETKLPKVTRKIRTKKPLWPPKGDEENT